MMSALASEHVRFCRQGACIEKNVSQGSVSIDNGMVVDILLRAIKVAQKPSLRPGRDTLPVQEIESILLHHIARFTEILVP